MAFVHHNHEGFRPGRRSKKQKRRPPSVQDLVLRATEEITANGDWLSECRGRSFSPDLGTYNSALCPPGLIRDCSELGTRYRVICLGLGSLSELPNARVQLAFLQLVLQHTLDIVSRPLFHP